MGCCSSIPISASLADELRDVEHASFPKYETDISQTYVRYSRVVSV